MRLNWDRAKSVASTLAEAFLSLADMPTESGKAQPGHVTRTVPKSNAHGPKPSAPAFAAMIERRALVKANRSKAAAQVYRDRHLSLFSAIYSGGEE